MEETDTVALTEGTETEATEEDEEVQVSAAAVDPDPTIVVATRKVEEENTLILDHHQEEITIPDLDLFPEALLSMDAGDLATIEEPRPAVVFKTADANLTLLFSSST